MADFLLSAKKARSSTANRPSTAPPVSFSMGKTPINISKRPMVKNAQPVKTASSFKPKPVPDFNSVHKKQFDGQKSITNIVPKVRKSISINKPRV
jgi:hypothetical protein